jgi:hypothetical protein
MWSGTKKAERAKVEERTKKHEREPLWQEGTKVQERATLTGAH